MECFLDYKQQKKKFKQGLHEPVTATQSAAQEIAPTGACTICIKDHVTCEAAFRIVTESTDRSQQTKDKHLNCCVCVDDCNEGGRRRCDSDRMQMDRFAYSLGALACDFTRGIGFRM